MVFCKRWFWLSILASVLLTASAAGQAVPAGFGPAQGLWAGVEYSNMHAGFPYQSDQRLWGIGAFANYHLGGNLGIAGEARFLRFNSYYGETQDHYLAGPRYRFPRFGRVQPFAQCLVGLGHMQYPFQIGSGTYFAVAPGGEVTYRLARRWALRGLYEYQIWPGSPNAANEPQHAIKPNGFHLGVAFRVR
jgi:Outer membrane protein beta-barrel domain